MTTSSIDQSSVSKRWLSSTGLVLLVGLGAAAACGPSASTPAVRNTAARNNRTNEPTGEPMPHEACVAGGGDVREFMVGEGRPTPVKEVRRSGRLFCRETDANFDGLVDITRFFDEQGRVRRVEDDYDFDGRLDLVAMYREGVISEDLLDMNFDGRADTWRNYVSGRVVRSRRDQNSDGMVDLWEDFDERGNVTRSAHDLNSDGRPDEDTDAGSSAGASASGQTLLAAQNGPPPGASSADGGAQ